MIGRATLLPLTRLRWFFNGSPPGLEALLAWIFIPTMFNYICSIKFLLLPQADLKSAILKESKRVLKGFCIWGGVWHIPWSAYKIVIVTIIVIFSFYVRDHCCQMLKLKLQISASTWSSFKLCLQFFLVFQHGASFHLLHINRWQVKHLSVS